MRCRDRREAAHGCFRSWH